MGFALPAAFGAKIGDPDREVIAVIGDGGFQMTIQELGTIFQSEAAVKIVILNNNFLADIGFTQQEVRPFTDYLMNYQRTGKPANTNGNVYGDRWYLDGKLWKDRTKGITKLDGSKANSTRMSHNMMNVEGELPYRKQLDRKDQFGSIYAGKPLKIKNSGEKY